MSIAIRQQIAILSAQASRIEAEEKAEAAAQIVRAAVKAAREAEEAVQAARQAEAALTTARPTSLTVFITADEVGLRKGHIHIEDFRDMVAFSYQLKQDLSVPFNTLSQDDFIRYICRQNQFESGDGYDPKTARNIHNIMTRLNNDADVTRAEFEQVVDVLQRVLAAVRTDTPAEVWQDVEITMRTTETLHGHNGDGWMGGVLRKGHAHA